MGVFSRTTTDRTIKAGDGRELYIQQSRNQHLRQILSPPHSGSHRLYIKAGQHIHRDKHNSVCIYKRGNLWVPADYFNSCNPIEEPVIQIVDGLHVVLGIG